VKQWASPVFGEASFLIPRRMFEAKPREHFAPRRCLLHQRRLFLHQRQSVAFFKRNTIFDSKFYFPPMKRFVFAIAFCTFLTGVLSFFLFPVTRAAENPLLTLLNLPAPPPTNPHVSLQPTERPPGFFSRSNPPADDSPIEELMY